MNETLGPVAFRDSRRELVALGMTFGEGLMQSWNSVMNRLGKMLQPQAAEAAPPPGGLTLIGGIGGDQLTGGTGNDTINGRGGDDTLTGAAGKDSLHGGAGNDHLAGGTGADVLHGGGGTDWATYSASSHGVYVDLLAGNGLAGEATGDVLVSIENVLGSALADTLAGNDAANALYGGAGNDILYGGRGSDVLRGGMGADQLNGGGGLDWANYRDSSSGVFVNLLEGTATGGDASGDQLTSIENLAGGKFYDQLIGGNGANVLHGNGGNDTLHGNGGNDLADGGDGKDFLTGGDGEDIMLGGKGNDLIDAGSGEDVIKGGAGNDVIYGGPDPDVIVYDFAWEDITATYNGGDFSIWVDAPDGRDHVFTALTIATTTGTYRYDVPTASWVFESAMTGDDWLGL